MAIFFFNDTATTEIYPLSLHDALPIFEPGGVVHHQPGRLELGGGLRQLKLDRLKFPDRSEEHTSELQSRLHLVCRLLLEKKKKSRQIRQVTSVLDELETRR